MERVGIFRRGFAETLKDPELLAEANKSKLVITLVSGKRTEKLVNEILSLPTDVKENLAFLVRPKGT